MALLDDTSAAYQDDNVNDEAGFSFAYVPPPVHKHVEGDCPLSTEQIVDLVLNFAEVYGGMHGIELHDYQTVFMRRIVAAVLYDEGCVITGLWARQSGKSEALASLAPALCILLPTLARLYSRDTRLTAFKEGFWLGIFAPKAQQATIIYQRIRSRAEKDITKEQIYDDKDFALRVAASRGDIVSWSNGSFVNASTASEYSNSEGKTYHLVIIDEAQLVSKQKVNKEIKPMLASTNGVLVEIGTANALRGNFRTQIKQNLIDEKRGWPRSHFEFPYDVVITSRSRTYERTKDPKHLRYAKWVKEELRRLGNNIENEEFRQNFRLCWQELNVGAIDLEAFFAARNNELSIVESLYRGRIVAGLDYGRKRDVTILTVLLVHEDTPIVDKTAASLVPGMPSATFFKKTVLAWYEIPGRRWRDILAGVVKILGNYAVDTVVCDGTGIGDPLTDRLSELLPGVAFIPFIMSAPGNDYVYKLYTQEIEAGRFEYPASPATLLAPVFLNFTHEHEQLVRDRTGSYTKYFAPPDEHDDYPDSCALANLAATYPRFSPPTVEVDENPFYGRKMDAGSRADRYRLKEKINEADGHGFFGTAQRAADREAHRSHRARQGRAGRRRDARQQRLLGRGPGRYHRGHVRAAHGGRRGWGVDDVRCPQERRDHLDRHEADRRRAPGEVAGHPLRQARQVEALVRQGGRLLDRPHVRRGRHPDPAGPQRRGAGADQPALEGLLTCTATERVSWTPSTTRRKAGTGRGLVAAGPTWTRSLPREGLSRTGRSRRSRRAWRPGAKRPTGGSLGPAPWGSSTAETSTEVASTCSRPIPWTPTTGRPRLRADRRCTRNAWRPVRALFA